ncbi:MAG: hypothetical protein ACYDDB_03465 [bacterium]
MQFKDFIDEINGYNTDSLDMMHKFWSKHYRELKLKSSTFIVERKADDEAVILLKILGFFEEINARLVNFFKI